MAKEGIGHGSADTVDKSNISQHFYIDPLRAKSTVKHDNVRYKTTFIEYIYWYWYLLNRINKLLVLFNIIAKAIFLLDSAKLLSKFQPVLFAWILNRKCNSTMTNVRLFVHLFASLSVTKPPATTFILHPSSFNLHPSFHDF